ncbi:hypothetical protein [Dictyobacter formicarum]|nr:hypothetical protein [Dictyobacter formicarum]
MMTETDWTITWLAPLMPEAAMIPGGDVFLKSSQQSSLVALHDHTPGLLFSTPGTLVTVAQQMVARQTIEGGEETIQKADTVAESTEADSQPVNEDFVASGPHIDQDFVAFLDMEAESFIL